MTKQLTLDEMLACLISIKHPPAPTCQMLLEGLGSAMAHTIAAALGVKARGATYQGLEFAGTCAPFAPTYRGQACPAPLVLYDPGEWDSGNGLDEPQD